MKNKNNHPNGEYLFLSGPGNRWDDFKSAFQIMMEFIKGYRKLHFVGPCITVFGSARFDENHPYYKQAVDFGKRIAQSGFTVMTGGGPGIMEAANRGAKEGKGCSVGCNIVLPKEQYANPYLDVMITMKRFYVRKVLLLKYSYAFVVFPGGFGTMDEMFETLTLIQTKKIARFPLVLMGKEYWTPLLGQLEEMKKTGTISAPDTDLFLLTDSIEEGMEYIMNELRAKFGKDAVLKKAKSRWWLGEQSYYPKNGGYTIKLQ